MFIRSDADGLRNKFLETASSHLGYVARAGMQSVYGGTVGYQGNVWSGAFIDVVARETGIELPACVYSPSGLAEFIYQRRWHARPRTGDIVFYTFPTNELFGMPHVGIVTDTREWRHGRLEAIEGQTASGLAKGGQLNDGVYRRVRHRHEVLGFGRPGFTPIKGGTDVADIPNIKLAHLQSKRRHASIALVQRALAQTTGLHAITGVIDGETTSALRRWQRSIGCLDGELLDLPSLRRLGRDTGTFSIELAGNFRVEED